MIRRFDMSSGASEAISFNEPEMRQTVVAADVSSAVPLQAPQLRLLGVDEAAATQFTAATVLQGTRHRSRR